MMTSFILVVLTLVIVEMSTAVPGDLNVNPSMSSDIMNTGDAELDTSGEHGASECMLQSIQARYNSYHYYAIVCTD